MVRDWKRIGLAAAVIAVGLLGWVGSASADSITMNTTGIDRAHGWRDQNENPNWISRQDCLADDTFSFPVSVNITAGYNVEVWVTTGSYDCSQYANRNPTYNYCRFLHTQQVGSSFAFDINIPVRRVLAQVKTTTPLPSTTTSWPVQDESVCEPTEGMSSAGVTLNFYFLIIPTGTGDAAASDQPWASAYDLVGPNPPTGLKAGIGDTMLALNWDQSTDTDLLSYQFFCDPPPGAEIKDSGADSSSRTLDFTPQADEDGGDGAVEAATDDDASGQGSDDAAGADDADGGTGDGASDGATKDAADAASAGSCGSGVLIAGQNPPTDARYKCGTAARQTTDSHVSNLINYKRYSVAIAGVDAVGNVGKLSNVVCETPNPVDDFYKKYREAGGEAGGAFCSVPSVLGHGDDWLAVGVVALAGVAELVRRRRNR